MFVHSHLLSSTSISDGFAEVTIAEQCGIAMTDHGSEYMEVDEYFHEKGHPSCRVHYHTHTNRMELWNDITKLCGQWSAAC